MAYIANFKTGLESIEINGDTLWFNAHDLNFPDKFMKFCDLALSMNGLAKDEKDERVIAEKLHKAGDEINKGIDDLFGQGSAALLFKGISPITLTFGDDGNSDGTLVTNFIDAITPYVKEKFEMYAKAEKKQRSKYKKALSEILEEVEEYESDDE